MSSDNRTPRLHSFRIACAIASATLCATAIAQVAFSLKPAIEVLDNPVIADSPAYPALAISTLVPAVIGIATTILSAVLVWTIKSGDPFKKGSATCLKVLGILFVVQAATSLYAGSLKTSVSMFGGEGAVGAQEIASSFDWTSLVLGIVLFMLSPPGFSAGSRATRWRCSSWSVTGRRSCGRNTASPASPCCGRRYGRPFPPS